MSEDRSLRQSFQELHLSSRQQIAILFLNYIPFVHVALIICTLAVPWAMLRWRIITALAVLYLLPPLLARCLLRLRPIREGHIRMPSRDYFTWWTVLNLQIVFCRLPLLEELIRFIPGAYSVWLRLWGSRIGAFIYWAAGLRILDRSFLDIGSGVAFGAGVRLNPHVIAEDADGRLELLLATVHIGDRAVIGGYALLTAGTRVASDERTRGCLISSPFSTWQGGRRVKEHTPSDTTEAPDS